MGGPSIQTDGGYSTGGGGPANIDPGTIDTEGIKWNQALLRWQPNDSHIQPGSGFYYAGATGGTFPSGAGTRFMWDAANQAVRWGDPLGTDWDAANVGFRSFASGPGTRAFGVSSFAYGNAAIADADLAFALGLNQDINGMASFGHGTNNTEGVNGQGNYLLGNDNVVGDNQLFNFILGDNNTVPSAAIFGGLNVLLGSNHSTDGTATFMLGINNANLLGDLVVMMGQDNTNTGSANLIIGQTNVVTGTLNNVQGLQNTVTANQNVISGANNIATSDENILFGGQNNASGGSGNVSFHDLNIFVGGDNFALGSSNDITGNQNIALFNSAVISGAGNTGNIVGAQTSILLGGSFDNVLIAPLSVISSSSSRNAAIVGSGHTLEGVDNSQILAGTNITLNDADFDDNSIAATPRLLLVALSGNNSSRTNSFQSEPITTPDATPVTLVTVEIAEDEATQIEVKLVGKEPSAGNIYSSTEIITASRSGAGAPTINGPTTIFQVNNLFAPPPGVTFVVVGNTIEYQVDSGMAGQDIRWTAKVEVVRNKQ